MTPLLRADGAPSRFFVLVEFRCRCAGRHGVECAGYPDVGAENAGIDPDLVSLLDAIREAIGPVHVNCGYRCPAHNAAVGGAPASLHLVGKAADLVARRAAPGELYGLADSLLGGRGGCGHYPSFVHVDVGPTVRRKFRPEVPWRRMS